MTCVGIAALEGNDEAIKLLLQSGADVQKKAMVSTRTTMMVINLREY